MNNDLRWKQRFQNFENAYNVFCRRIDEYEKNLDHEAYQMALIQGFEIVIELAWKTMKDYLENEGYDEVKNAKHAIRFGFQDGLFRTPELWMQAIETRNSTSHIYDPEIFKKTLKFIGEKFGPVVRDLYFELKAKL